ncbi:MAG: hypothetical protein S0880_11330 [Actinomycetota bacterium]|nr:hypothetical protein [Actinomycetota bacterium]
MGRHRCDLGRTASDGRAVAVDRCRRGKGADRGHGGGQAAHRRHRGGRAVERPRPAAEGEGAHPERGLGEDDDGAEAHPTVERSVGQRPEHGDVGGDHHDDRGDDRALAQSGRLVLEVEQAATSGGEAVDDPALEPEQAHLLGRWRIDRESVGVVGVALGVAHRFGVAVPPDGALTQEPVGRQPGGNEQQRRPPREPEQHQGGGEPADHLHEPAGDEPDRHRQRRSGDAEVEVAGHRQVVGERRPLEVGDARRVGTRPHESLVQPPRGAAAEVGPDRFVERGEHLEEHEHDADRDERTGERPPALHGIDEKPGRDGEHRRRRPGHQHQRPPHHGERPVRLPERHRQLPLLPIPETNDHHRGPYGPPLTPVLDDWDRSRPTRLGSQYG